MGLAMADVRPYIPGARTLQEANVGHDTHFITRL